jgi:hypothetical protein
MKEIWKKIPICGHFAIVFFLIAVVLLYVHFSLVPTVFTSICSDGPCVSTLGIVLENIFLYSIYPLWASILQDLIMNSDFALVIATLLYFLTIGTFIGILVEKKKGHRA